MAATPRKFHHQCATSPSVEPCSVSWTGFRILAQPRRANQFDLCRYRLAHQALQGAKSACAQNRNWRAGSTWFTRPVPPRKISRFCFSETCDLVSRIPPRKRGASRIVTNVGVGCGRPRRVVLTPRRWCQVLLVSREPSRAAMRDRLRNDRGKTARSPGSALCAVKTIAWGMPDVSGASAVNTGVHTPTT